MSGIIKYFRNSVLRVTARIRICGFMVVFLAIFINGCTEESGTGPTTTRFTIIMEMTNADYSVYLDDTYIGRLDNVGEKISVDIDPGDHAIFLFDNATEFYSRTRTKHVPKGYEWTMRICMDCSDEDIIWIEKAKFDLISAEIDYSSGYCHILLNATFTYSPTYYLEDLCPVMNNFYLGLYWMQKCGDSYCFVDKAPDAPYTTCYFSSFGKVGRIQMFFASCPMVDEATHIHTWEYSKACFPNTVSTTYYAMAIFYDPDGEIESPGDNVLISAGPPNSILRLYWDSAGVPHLSTE